MSSIGCQLDHIQNQLKFNNEGHICEGLLPSLNWLDIPLIQHFQVGRHTSLIWNILSAGCLYKNMEKGGFLFLPCLPLPCQQVCSFTGIKGYFGILEYTEDQLTHSALCTEQLQDSGTFHRQPAIVWLAGPHPLRHSNKYHIYMIFIYHIYTYTHICVFCKFCYSMLNNQ